MVFFFLARPAHIRRLCVEPVIPLASELVRRLGDSFTTRTSWRGPQAADAVWSNIELEGDQGVLGLYTSGDQAWTLARITPAGRARMEALASEHGPAWRGLGVAILHRLVLDELLRPGEAAGSPLR